MSNYTKKLSLNSEKETKNFSKRFAQVLIPPLIIGFQGEIGAGKTTMIRAMLQALGIKTAIKSPTFALVESYSLQDFEVHHFDLYRVHHEEELEYIGFREYFSQNTVCCIEWPLQAGRLLPLMDIMCTIDGHDSSRVLQLCSYTQRGTIILKSLTGDQ